MKCRLGFADEGILANIFSRCLYVGHVLPGLAVAAVVVVAIVGIIVVIAVVALALLPMPRQPRRSELEAPVLNVLWL